MEQLTEIGASVALTIGGLILLIRAVATKRSLTLQFIGVIATVIGIAMLAKALGRY